MLCNTLRKYVKISMTFPMKTIKRQNVVNKVLQLLHVNMEMNRIRYILNFKKTHATRISEKKPTAFISGI